MNRLIILCLGLLFSSLSLSADSNLAQGKGKFVINDKLLNNPMNVYYYQPESLTKQSPLVVVFHGLLRNADEYRDKWVELAEENSFMILAPEISANTYPGMNGYNLGNVMAAKDQFIQKDRKFWSFQLVDQVIDHYAENIIQSNEHENVIIGHSAGCQFTHRMMMLMPTTKADLVICSAAGWYTLPDRDAAWPYGIKEINNLVSDDQLKQSFRAPYLLMVGEKDNSRVARTLRRTPEAMQQGRQRVERAQNYFEYNKALAEKMGADFNWQFRIAPNVSHASTGVAKFAANSIKTFLETGELPEQQALAKKVNVNKLSPSFDDVDEF